MKAKRVKKANVVCNVKWVYLWKNGNEIEYGDLTKIIDNKMPKSQVINGKRVKIHYTKEMYEQFQHSYTDSIVYELNDLLPNATQKQHTLYYFTKIKQVTKRLVVSQ